MLFGYCFNRETIGGTTTLGGWSFLCLIPKRRSETAFGVELPCGCIERSSKFSAAARIQFVELLRTKVSGVSQGRVTLRITWSPSCNLGQNMAFTCLSRRHHFLWFDNCLRSKWTKNWVSPARPASKLAFLWISSCASSNMPGLPKKRTDHRSLSRSIIGLPILEF